MRLLWVLRDHLGKTETKFGCGMAECGTCMVLIDGKLARSCSTTIAEVNGKAVTTIEGLADDPNHPLQKGWADGKIPECDYCQPGQTLAAAALLAQNPHPSKKDVKKALAGIPCRCDGRKQIRKLIMDMV
jgi:aerobic-type carbon monoxide dehydrogenase small subunit (CoxS/CutS family)